MIKKNAAGVIVKVEVEEYPVSRDVIVKRVRELRADLAQAEKDLGDYDHLTAAELAEQPAPDPVTPPIPPAPEAPPEPGAS